MCTLIFMSYRISKYKFSGKTHIIRFKPAMCYQDNFENLFLYFETCPSLENKHFSTSHLTVLCAFKRRPTSKSFPA